jgi:hypothetical protein
MKFTKSHWPTVIIEMTTASFPLSTRIPSCSYLSQLPTEFLWVQRPGGRGQMLHHTIYELTCKVQHVRNDMGLNLAIRRSQRAATSATLLSFSHNPGIKPFWTCCINRAFYCSTSHKPSGCNSGLKLHQVLILHCQILFTAKARDMFCNFPLKI